MNKFQLGEKVVVSKDCPNHGGKSGTFQLQATVGKADVAIIQDSNTKRQFKVGLEYVEKA